MGKRKRSFGVLKFLFYGSFLAALPLLIFSGWIYWTLPNIEPNKCMTTAMFKVSLCPGKGGYVRYGGFSKDLIDALILSEDGSFFSHKGFDWYEIKESMKQNWKEGRIARGGSTITQQLAKNMYLSKDKTISRKIKEYFIAHQMEEKFKKAQILERYLNIVEFGPKLYGAPKAARKYFQKSPSQLSTLESIYLISLLPNPKSYSRSFQTRNLTSGNRYRMKIILRRFYRYRKMATERYEYFLNLIETEAWPFGGGYEYIPSVQSELEDEFSEIGDGESQDKTFVDEDSPQVTQDPGANGEESEEPTGEVSDEASAKANDLEPGNEAPETPRAEPDSSPQEPAPESDRDLETDTII